MRIDYYSHSQAGDELYIVMPVVRYYRARQILPQRYYCYNYLGVYCSSLQKAKNC
jgi:hypothetical protein